MAPSEERQRLEIADFVEDGEGGTQQPSEATPSTEGPFFSVPGGRCRSLWGILLRPQAWFGWGACRACHTPWPQMVSNRERLSWGPFPGVVVWPHHTGGPFSTLLE